MCEHHRTRTLFVVSFAGAISGNLGPVCREQIDQFAKVDIKRQLSIITRLKFSYITKSRFINLSDRFNLNYRKFKSKTQGFMLINLLLFLQKLMTVP